MLLLRCFMLSTHGNLLMLSTHGKIMDPASTMLAVAMLKDVLREFYVWGVFKRFWQKLC